jgi:rhodanese-related sulfurtransferase
MDTAFSSSAIPISSETLAAEFTSPAARALIFDVRKADAFAESEHFIPGALRWDYDAGQSLPAALKPGQTAVAYCIKGANVGMTGAEKLTLMGARANYLEGGIRSWREAGFPTVKKRPDLGVDGERVSTWVTRERPKIDRIACPWLIKRFIDPRAQFLYVPTAQVFETAKQKNAVAFDIPGAPIEHDGPRCSFDALLAAFELDYPPLNRLATIVRGADTDALHLAPQSAGLLAISLGLSKINEDDHAMLAQGMVMYDALFQWCATQTNETHQWAQPK